MDNKDKIIKEMAKDLEPFITLHREVYVSANRKERHAWMLSEEDNKVIAEHLCQQGYRKLSEDSVVLSREEYEKLKSRADNKCRYDCDLIDMPDFEREKTLIEKTSKETAEKILNDMADLKIVDDKVCAYELASKLNKLEKQFGVEIKEN